MSASAILSNNVARSEIALAVAMLINKSNVGLNAKMLTNASKAEVGEHTKCRVYLKTTTNEEAGYVSVEADKTLRLVLADERLADLLIKNEFALVR